MHAGCDEYCVCTRRAALAGLAAAGMNLLPDSAAASEHAPFVRAAFVMKDQAVAAGDQAYGAVVVQGGRIVGWGPSRVVAKGDPTAHAEREAMRDAQARLATPDLSTCVMYSTSRPCGNCERAAAEGRLARMFYGAQATDAGAPRRG